MDNDQHSLATFGGGCFWCTEAVFRELLGVQRVIPGYAGGSGADPTYEDICTGTTGHAEVIQIEFDPAQVTFETLLEVFFRTHDPTTLNRQGNDRGTQYRSVVFHHDDAQRDSALRAIEALNDGAIWPDPLVTEVSPFTEFYAAEGYHHDYFSRNAAQPYCFAVIAPKMAKFRDAFRSLLKDSGGD